MKIVTSFFAQRMSITLFTVFAHLSLICSTTAEPPSKESEKPQTTIATSFDSLPPELITNILEYLSWEEHANFLLLNKTVAENFNPYTCEGKEKKRTDFVNLPLKVTTASYLSRWLERKDTDNFTYYKQNKQFEAFLKKYRFNLFLTNLFEGCPQYKPIFCLIKKTLSKSLTEPQDSYPIKNLHIIDDQLCAYFLENTTKSILPYKTITSLTLSGKGKIGHQSFINFCTQNPLQELKLKKAHYVDPKTISALLKNTKTLEYLFLPENFRFDQIEFELLKKIPAIYILLDKKPLNLNTPNLTTITIYDDYCPDLAATLSYLLTNYPSINTLVLKIEKETAQKLLDDTTFNFFIFNNITNLTLTGTKKRAGVPHTFITKILDSCPKLASLTMSPIPRFDLLDTPHLNRLKNLAKVYIPIDLSRGNWTSENINNETLTTFTLCNDALKPEWTNSNFINFILKYRPSITCLKIKDEEAPSPQQYNFKTNTVTKLIWRGGESVNLNSALTCFSNLQHLDLAHGLPSHSEKLDRTVLDNIPEVIVWLGKQRKRKNNKRISNDHTYENLKDLKDYTAFDFDYSSAKIKDLSFLLPYLKNVQKIRIWDRDKIGEVWNCLNWPLLKECKQLKELDLHYCSLEPQGDREKNEGLTLPPHHFSIELINTMLLPSTTPSVLSFEHNSLAQKICPLTERGSVYKKLFKTLFLAASLYGCYRMIHYISGTNATKNQVGPSTIKAVESNFLRRIIPFKKRHPSI